MNASTIARATRPAPSEPRTAAVPEQDERLGAQEHAPAHRAEQPLPEEQRRADRDEERDEDERRDRDPDRDGDGPDLAADLRGLGPGEVDVRPDEADERVPRGAELAAQARRRWRRRAVPARGAATAGSSVARRVRIRLERSACRAGFGRGTRVVGCGPIGIQRMSSGSGVGSRRGTAAIIPAPTPASGRPIGAGASQAPDGGATLGAWPTSRRPARSSARSCSRSAPSSPSARRSTRTAASWRGRSSPTASRCSGSRTCPTTRRSSWRRCATRSRARTSWSRPAGSARRPTTSPARPSRRLCGEAVDVDPPTLAWLRGAVGAAPAAVPRGQREAGLAHPVGDDAAEPERHGARVVGRPARRRGHRHAARPPREMRPMWEDEVLPRLAARGVGADIEVRTLRLTGIGESVVAELLGDALLRAANPSRRDLRAAGGGRRADLAPAAADGRDGRRSSPTRPRRSCRAPSASTSGRTAPTTWAAALDGGARGTRLDARDHRARHRRRARPAAAVAAGGRARGAASARPSDGRTRATTAGDLAEARAGPRPRRAPTWASRSARGRGGDDTIVHVAIATPDGHARRAAGRVPARDARARTGRRSPARRSLLAALRDATDAPTGEGCRTRRAPSGGPPAGGRRGPGSRSRRAPSGSARRRRRTRAACSRSGGCCRPSPRARPA